MQKVLLCLHGPDLLEEILISSTLLRLLFVLFSSVGQVQKYQSDLYRNCKYLSTWIYHSCSSGEWVTIVQIDDNRSRGSTHNDVNPGPDYKQRYQGIHWIRYFALSFYGIHCDYYYLSVAKMIYHCMYTRKIDYITLFLPPTIVGD